ncbi:MAG TPA: methyltransferase domain-containing protein [Pseudolabrys sp.]|nr:methyltransferase domain-containing protein [Pseudolabrys sp.]
MNRKQRRSAGTRSETRATETTVSELLLRAAGSLQEQNLEEAARLYKRVRAIEPTHAHACNGLASVLLAQGKRKEASRMFAELIEIAPEAGREFSNISGILGKANPTLALAIERAARAWPKPLVDTELLGEDTDIITDDPFLHAVLTSMTVRDIGLERFLTLVRRDALARLAEGAATAASPELGFYGALAQQCFINEYVFAQTDEEAAQVDLLATKITAALDAGAPIAPSAVVALAMYVPLNSIAGAERLLSRHWPAPTVELLRQQIREPLEERELRASIPRLTEIDDPISIAVRQQYEDNPYPRWVRTAAPPTSKLSINEYVRSLCPSAAFNPIEANRTLEVLVAGCGTGSHPIELAQVLSGCRILAVDLSLSSLAYAKRKTTAELPLEYAQADILRLGAIGRTFDIIDSVGVLHHMADPVAGWDVLVSLLRPGGLMRVGLYSEIARRGLIAARALIEQRGFASTPEGIRRCRQELFSSPVMAGNDLFSISDCRDLLFHVQEQRFTLPAIKGLVAKSNVRFIGLVLPPESRETYRQQFRAHGWSMSDLDRWAKIEEQNPGTFVGMYNFWVQKPSNDDPSS